MWHVVKWMAYVNKLPCLLVNKRPGISHLTYWQKCWHPLDRWLYNNKAHNVQQTCALCMYIYMQWFTFYSVFISFKDLQGCLKRALGCSSCKSAVGGLCFYLSAIVQPKLFAWHYTMYVATIQICVEILPNLFAELCRLYQGYLLMSCFQRWNFVWYLKVMPSGPGPFLVGKLLNWNLASKYHEKNVAKATFKCYI